MRTRYILPAAIAMVAVVVLAGCPKEEEFDMAKEAPTARSVAEMVDVESLPVDESKTGTVTAYYPCGMMVPLVEAIMVFNVIYPNIDIKPVNENATVLVEMVLDGDRPDVFMAPGHIEIGRLEEAGLADPDAKVAVGSFAMVVAKNKSMTKKLDEPADLVNLTAISMANPEINSVGDSGRSSLQSLGLWEDVAPLIVPVTQTSDSHQAILNETVDAAIMYKACPLETNPEKLGEGVVEICFELPAGSYEQEKCWLTVMKDAKDVEAAQLFVDFVSSARGLKILDEYDLSGAGELLAETEKED